MTEEKKLVGVEIEEKSIEIKDSQLVGKIALKHQGKIGGLKITLEGDVSAVPFINKGIDWLESVIPGDQKAWAQLAKEAVAKIKL
jgi:hypothetical protein